MLRFELCYILSVCFLRHFSDKNAFKNFSGILCVIFLHHNHERTVSQDFYSVQLAIFPVVISCWVPNLKKSKEKRCIIPVNMYIFKVQIFLQ